MPFWLVSYCTEYWFIEFQCFHSPSKHDLRSSCRFCSTGCTSELSWMSDETRVKNLDEVYRVTRWYWLLRMAYCTGSTNPASFTMKLTNHSSRIQEPHTTIDRLWNVIITPTGILCFTRPQPHPSDIEVFCSKPAKVIVCILRIYHCCYNSQKYDVK